MCETGNTQGVPRWESLFSDAHTRKIRLDASLAFTEVEDVANIEEGVENEEETGRSRA
jgi:hypothetical protein